jgi:V/A-type H+-transporting ATPase subunit C
LSRFVARETWPRLLESGPAATVPWLRSTWVAPAVTDDGRILWRDLRGEVASAEQTLGRFLPRSTRPLIAWYNRRFEIENLKTVLRAIHYGVERPRARLALIPLRSSRCRFDEWLEAGSIAALINQMKPSSYARPLEQAVERYQQERRSFYLEVAVDLFYFRRLVRLIELQKNREASDARSFLGRWIAIQNLLWAYRYRIYARMSPEEIINYTLHSAFATGLETVRRVALGAPLEGEARRLGFVLSSGLSEIEALTELELLAERERYRQAALVINRPLFSLGGVLAYLSLLESQVRDLMVIAEGKRIGLTSNDIARRLLRTL